MSLRRIGAARWLVQWSHSWLMHVCTRAPVTVPLAADDARAFIANCPRCDEPSVIVSDPVRLYVSRFSIPFADAEVLARYQLMVWNVWQARRGLMATPWVTLGPPSRGRLYALHVCGLWR